MGRPPIDSEEVRARVHKPVLERLDAVVDADGSRPSRADVMRRALHEYLGDPGHLPLPSAAELALDFYKSANGHLRAAITINQDIDPAGSVVFGFYNVLGFTCELYLKTYLASKSVSLNEILSYRLRHNLENLYKRAFELGFMGRDIPRGVDKSAIDKIVDSLNGNHASYTYRYPRRDSTLTVFTTREARISVLEAFRRIDNMLRETVV